MDSSLAWRAAVIQLACVALLFAVLLALPLPSEFFRDHGALVGPASWLACSLASGRALGLGYGTTLAIAVGGGLVGGLVGLLAGHGAGMVAGVLAFGLLAGVRGQSPAPAGAR